MEGILESNMDTINHKLPGATYIITDCYIPITILPHSSTNYTIKFLLVAETAVFCTQLTTLVIA